MSCHMCSVDGLPLATEFYTVENMVSSRSLDDFLRPTSLKSFKDYMMSLLNQLILVSWIDMQLMRNLDGNYPLHSLFYLDGSIWL